MPSLKRRELFTTGQVAKMCGVAPRTVSKWFDSGKLRGYRIPGSDDRRIPREHLVRFLSENGMPLLRLDDAPFAALFVGPCGALADRLRELLHPSLIRVEHAATGFHAGAVIHLDPSACVLDFALGRPECLVIAGCLRSRLPRPLLVALTYEDDAGPIPGFDLSLPQPADPAALAAILAVRDRHLSGGRR